MHKFINKSDINFYWEMDFQTGFILDSPIDKRPFLALAGGALHEDLYLYYKQLMEEYGIIELKKKKDFNNRDNGFSLNKCIRDNKLKIVKVYDEKRKKTMRAMPDIVDYSKDTIIDLKTYYMSDPTPPDEGGIFLTHENQFPSTLPEGILSNKDDVPDGYEDAWGNLKEKIEGELYDKYKSQLTRYYEAYYLTFRISRK
ncbi:MAG: hypothetical protein Q7U02_02895, partial [Desulfosalsimonadaceae bacterium]|nr:hypothetical protein [Desulfosalsimonadaceae bacterium]